MLLLLGCDAPDPIESGTREADSASHDSPHDSPMESEPIVESDPPDSPTDSPHDSDVDTAPGTWRSALYPEEWTPDFTDADGYFLHDFS